MKPPAVARAMPSTIVFAGSLAALCWLGLYAEGIISLQRSLASGFGLGHAGFVFFRFFTNLTVAVVGAVMTVTAWRSWRRAPLLSPAVYAALLVYILVVSATYELLLRRLWSPHGIWFARDALMHDVIPALMLLFWLIRAPKASISWYQPLVWLWYPSAYVLVVVAAGILGQGYPYPFLDLDALGYRGFIGSVLGFTAVFLMVGFLVRWVAGRLSQTRLAIRQPEQHRPYSA